MTTNDKLFSLPADFKTETLDRYSALHGQYPDSRVVATYGNITINNLLGSGRNLNTLPNVNLERFKNYLEYSKQQGIDFYYTLNASTMGNRELTREGMREILQQLEQLHDLGVTTLTITLPSLIELVRSSGLDFKIKASIICQIDSPNKARYFKNLGVDSIVAMESTYRDFDTLRRIREAFDGEVEIIANSACHQECQFRTFHYNQTSVDSVQRPEDCSISTKYYTARCVMRLYDDISHFFRIAWIRPEDLTYYKQIGIRHFKIQGRHLLASGDPVKTVEAYFREDYDGDFRNLLFLFSPVNILFPISNKSLTGFITPFYQNKHFCKRDCEQCKYCANFAKTVFPIDAFQQKKQEIIAMMMKDDEFRRALSDQPTTAIAQN